MILINFNCVWAARCWAFSFSFRKMITLLQWRVTIGCWNCCKIGGSNLCDTKINGLIRMLKCGGLLLLFVTLGIVHSLSALLLTLSGDIELNPGPGRWIHNICTVQIHTRCFCILGEKPRLEDALRLLKSHCHGWQDIGSGLKVSYNFRMSLLQQGVMSNDLCKLENILSTWIESKCSDVSWDHLIDVLREIELNDAADNITEYLLNDSKALEKYKWSLKKLG